MAYTGSYVTAQIAKSVYDRLATERYDKYPFTATAKRKWTNNFVQKLTDSMETLGCSPMGFVEAQFYFLSPAFCTRIWRCPYPIVGCLITEGARWRYRQWDQVRKSKGPNDVLRLNLSGMERAFEKHLREVEQWGKGTPAMLDTLLLRFASGMISPDVAIAMHMKEHPVIMPLWNDLKELPTIKSRILKHGSKTN